MIFLIHMILIIIKDINERHNWIQNNKESPVTWCYFHRVMFTKYRTKMRLSDSRYRYVCHSTVTIFDVIHFKILFLLITSPYYWKWIMSCMNDSINAFYLQNQGRKSLEWSLNMKYRSQLTFYHWLLIHLHFNDIFIAHNVL